MAKEMGLDRAPIEFQTFYFSHVLVVPPNEGPCIASPQPLSLNKIELGSQRLASRLRRSARLNWW